MDFVLRENPTCSPGISWLYFWVGVCLPTALSPCAVLSHSVVSNSATPWTVAHQAPLSMGISSPDYWSGLPCPPPGDLPNPGIEPRSRALQMYSLPSEPPGNILYMHAFMLSCVSRPTLRDPIDCSLPGSSAHRILQARILEWVAMPSSRGSS